MTETILNHIRDADDFVEFAFYGVFDLFRFYRESNVSLLLSLVPREPKVSISQKKGWR